jgi:hypothetical protein
MVVHMKITVFLDVRLWSLVERYQCILKMEATGSSETTVCFFLATQHHTSQRTIIIKFPPVTGFGPWTAVFLQGLGHIIPLSQFVPAQRIPTRHNPKLKLFCWSEHGTKLTDIPKFFLYLQLNLYARFINCIIIFMHTAQFLSPFLNSLCNGCIV